MRDKIVQRIQAIGGQAEAGPNQSLAEFIQSMDFPAPLFAVDDDLYKYGVHDFYESNKELYANSKQTFFKQLIEYQFSENETPRGQAFWRGRHFTPMTPGTADHSEWRGEFNEAAGTVDLSPIRSITGDGELQFMELVYSYGYPDHYYICLQDPNVNNPTVFSTDHEEYFSEIHVEGSLLTFFENMFTPEEFKTAAVKYIDSLRK